jgi:hypothetical protein
MGASYSVNNDIRAQPIPGPESELLDPLDAANPRGQLGT